MTPQDPAAELSDHVHDAVHDVLGRWADPDDGWSEDLVEMKSQVAEAVLATLAPAGLIWRPKAGSRRWQHRQHRDGRGYPDTAEFVDVFQLRTTT